MPRCFVRLKHTDCQQKNNYNFQQAPASITYSNGISRVEMDSSLSDFDLLDALDLLLGVIDGLDEMDGCPDGTTEGVALG
mmetsp:Transcript_3863/g.8310  ORF Transcript_3863/g.8310 Transcript_3863/m.8310 type:complete len:80 (-) Transcript_3863:550-789(-)